MADLSSLSPVLHFFYLAIAATLFFGGILVISNATFSGVIVGAYVLFFAVLLFLIQFRCPEKILNNAGFLFNYLGRGFFYIFLGCLVLQGDTVEDIPGGVVIAAGLICVILRFVKGAPPLTPMTGPNPHEEAPQGSVNTV
eukprot:TRINITY_DN1304_c0_g1_i1.p1 TRINITY_DN1304_c0_g1~~TRINITY_DN1304_c0_g1_i1.p1  ORF type:complete len:140 (-),score=33.35 TRINITY_DN1304_c0_g1_i1:81-500(-)